MDMVCYGQKKTQESGLENRSDLYGENLSIL